MTSAATVMTNSLGWFCIQLYKDKDLIIAWIACQLCLCLCLKHLHIFNACEHSYIVMIMVGSQMSKTEYDLKA